MVFFSFIFTCAGNRFPFINEFNKKFCLGEGMTECSKTVQDDCFSSQFHCVFQPK